MVKYRIKSSQDYFMFLIKGMTSEGQSYSVQAKFPFVPFWITTTRKFNTKEQAEEYILLIKKEY